VSLRNKLSRLATASSAPPPVFARADDTGRTQLLDDLRSRIRSTLERVARRAPPPLPRVDTAELPFVSFDTPLGALHTRTRRLGASHRTGRTPLAGAREARADMLALLALDPSLAACDPARALFLDTETTGLSGGTGTVAFLVGLAYWDGGSGQTLVLEQLLVRALGEEAPMLQRLRERIEAASMLVTFNGKSFDMPLLRTRFVMTRQPSPAEPPHLDLLHVARRVHGKHMADGCRLVAIERHVLGFERVDDVPSCEVSARYMHFLRTGDPTALLGVIEHNAWDVVSMAALVGLYGEPEHGSLAARDLVGIARTLRRAGSLDRAMAVADSAVERGSSPESLRARADIAKARGDRERALTDFETLAATVDDASVRLELAKIYEHWLKAPARALRCLEQGTGEPPASHLRRTQRLVRKAEMVHRKSGRRED
jgi:uncharacterized protein YprB with RNaseH-like and TPR domain